ncbi:MAG: hypothetical protein HY848_12060 [Betaproteobacteria bacterium]|nr:hypothetical protein [Betaproteobacteria bacterium]
MKLDSRLRGNDGLGDGSAHFVAESEPAQKELMIRLVLNLLEDGGA